MLDGRITTWEILGWLAGLLIIVLIDAIRELRPARGVNRGLCAAMGQNAAFDGEARAAQELFDKSADEELFPELKPHRARQGGSMAAEELLGKSA
ncbi:MAG: hypothetical protein LAP85_18520 [Acidobacteriia bacterium]|nr:hypothetical protein [Terriglobia bacterium]